jgi:hypothetical protein
MEAVVRRTRAADRTTDASGGRIAKPGESSNASRLDPPLLFSSASRRRRNPKHPK